MMKTRHALPVMLLMCGLSGAVLASPDNLWTFNPSPPSAGGYGPTAGVIEHPDGNLYGTASKGGYGGYGTLFRRKPDGIKVETIYSFENGRDGATPVAELTVGPDGALYGVASTGGNRSCGTIFRMKVTGGFKVIHTFNFNRTGCHPMGPLLLASDGNMYGTTSSGGSRKPGYSGTVYRLTLATGEVTKLRAVRGSPTAGLTEGSDGRLYGAEYQGNGKSGSTTEGLGTVFVIDKDGSDFATLAVLPPDGSKGRFIADELAEGMDGELYGMSPEGGEGRGTTFRVSKPGLFTLIDVPTMSDTRAPGSFHGGFTRATGGLYAASQSGGNGCGMIFWVDDFVKISTPIDSFSCAVQDKADGRLLAGSDGLLYGTTTGSGFYYGSLYVGDYIGLRKPHGPQ
jgi:uncharacterized repeat protein (TIGR03803 family)